MAVCHLPYSRPLQDSPNIFGKTMALFYQTYLPTPTPQLQQAPTVSPYPTAPVPMSPPARISSTAHPRSSSEPKPTKPIPHPVGPSFSKSTSNTSVTSTSPMWLSTPHSPATSAGEVHLPPSDPSAHHPPSLGPSAPCATGKSTS